MTETEEAAAGPAPPDAGEAGPPSPASREPAFELSARGVRDVLRGIPRFGLLLGRLVRDPRVSRLDRLLFGATLLYLVTPVDLVPDWLPVLGHADDLVLVFLALYRLLHRADPEVLREHWTGEEAPYDAIRGALDRMAGVVPGWTRRLLRAG